MNHPLIVGHRGAAALALENSFDAFAHAADAGVTWVETDVRVTADGVLVLHHDAYLGGLPIDRSKYDDLRVCGPHLATLQAVLHEFSSRLHFNLELKVPGVSKEVVHLLDDFGIRDKTVLSSFHHRELMNSRRAHSDIVHAPLISERPLRLDQFLSGISPLTIVVADADFADEELVSEAQALGAELWTYNIGAQADLFRLRSWGVAAFIVDDPISGLRAFKGD